MRVSDCFIGDRSQSEPLCSVEGGAAQSTVIIRQAFRLPVFEKQLAVVGPPEGTIDDAIDSIVGPFRLFRKRVGQFWLNRSLQSPFRRKISKYLRIITKTLIWGCLTELAIKLLKACLPYRPHSVWTQLRHRVASAAYAISGPNSWGNIVKDYIGISPG